MTVEELIKELAHSIDDASKPVYVDIKDVATHGSNTTHNVEEVMFYKNAVIIMLHRA